ncbi:hypothetical protein ACHHV8_35200 [Paenibacillus sp. TAB 01]|uniref:hypothetical protein n=1 Tax=Paenibacillus sp. TAB 01 TaxID=3368988 RepID=UPI0037513934
MIARPVNYFSHHPRFDRSVEGGKGGLRLRLPLHGSLWCDRQVSVLLPIPSASQLQA